MKVALLYSNLPIPFSQLLLCSFLREFLATPAFLPFFPFLPSSSVGKPFSALRKSFSLSFYKKLGHSCEDPFLFPVCCSVNIKKQEINPRFLRRFIFCSIFASD